jgi:hypothetical protein
LYLSSVSAVENNFFKTLFEYKTVFFYLLDNQSLLFFPTQTYNISTTCYTYRHKD